MNLTLKIRIKTSMGILILLTKGITMMILMRRTKNENNRNITGKGIMSIIRRKRTKSNIKTRVNISRMYILRRKRNIV